MTEPTEGPESLPVPDKRPTWEGGQSRREYLDNLRRWEAAQTGEMTEPEQADEHQDQHETADAFTGQSESTE